MPLPCEQTSPLWPLATQRHSSPRTSCVLMTLEGKGRSFLRVLFGWGIRSSAAWAHEGAEFSEVRLPSAQFFFSPGSSQESKESCVHVGAEPHCHPQWSHPARAPLCSSGPGLSLALFLSQGPTAPPGYTLLPCSPRLSHVTRPNPQWVSFTSTPGCCWVLSGCSSC